MITGEIPFEPTGLVNHPLTFAKCYLGYLIFVICLIALVGLQSNKGGIYVHEYVCVGVFIMRFNNLLRGFL